MKDWQFWMIMGTLWIIVAHGSSEDAAGGAMLLSLLAWVMVIGEGIGSLLSKARR